MENQIVQVVPWRDVLLGLTSKGEIYRLEPDNESSRPLHVTATLIFPGFPTR